MGGELIPFLRQLRTDMGPLVQITDPLDERILHRLMNDGPEEIERVCGRVDAAARMKRQRRESWCAWLRLLEERKRAIAARRLRTDRFSAVAVWEIAVRWHLLRLRVAGWAHFSGLYHVERAVMPAPVGLRLLA